MTAVEFRTLALRLAHVSESSHMQHPDFRVRGKIFASLGYPDEGCGMVKLTPEQQRTFVKRGNAGFQPCAGAWGKKGATSVQLASASPDLVRSALDMAWRNLSATGRALQKRNSSRAQ
jgi:hypothetical protein